MGFFERFRGKPAAEQKGLKPIEKVPLVPNFEVNEELEGVLKQYVELSSTLFGITHDSGIDMNTDIQDPKIRGNPGLKQAAEEYFQAQSGMTEIEKTYGDKIREYLSPYMPIANPPVYSNETSSDEWDRIRVASAFRK